MPDSATTVSDSGDGDPTAAEALRLFDVGLNVMPVPRGGKEPFGPHGFLDTTRLHRPWVQDLLAGCNLAVRTGRLSGNLFVLDCDTLADAAWVEAELAARGIAAWVRNSARGGQYWMRSNDGEVRNAAWGKVQVLGSRTYSMAPPSIHPNGMVYEWLDRDGVLPPLVSLSRLDFLPLRLEGHRHSSASAEKTHALPPRANEVLVEQDTSRYGGDHSRAENAAVLSLLSAGYSDGDVLDLFRMFPPPHFSRKGEDHFLAHTLRYAHEFLDHSARRGGRDATPTASVAAAGFVAWAEGSAWAGRTGNTDRAIYVALCHRMALDGGMPFRAAVREIAEIANVHKETAIAALRRLKEKGLVIPAGMDQVTGASRYTLCLPPQADIIRPLSPKGIVGEPTGRMTNSGDPSRNTGDDLSDYGQSDFVAAGVEHDAWHSRALGKSAYYCWACLRDSPGLTRQELALRTGRAEQTIKRALARLAEHDLIAPAVTGWEAINADAEKLNSIAHQCGTLGKAQKRIETHREERAKRATEILMRQKQRWQSAHPG